MYRPYLNERINMLERNPDRRGLNNAFSLLNVFFGAVLPHTIYNSQDYSSNYNSTVCTKKALFLLDFPHFFS